MKKIILAIAAMATAIAPVNAQITQERKNAGEENRFYKDTNRDKMGVYIVTYPNLMTLQQAATKFGMEDVSRIRAFSTWSRGNTLCTIHIVAPKEGTTPDSQRIGHELLHCFYGDWHRNES